MTASDRIAVLTSENVRLSYTLAGLGSRMTAFIIDSILITLGIFGISIIFYLGGSIRFSDFEDISKGMSVALAIYIAVTTFLIWGYYFFFEWINWGQTPGKQIMGLRVAMADGAPADIGACAVRNVIRIVDNALAAVGITIFIMIFTPRYQRLGDIAAGTVVVRRRRLTIDEVISASRAADKKISSQLESDETARSLSKIKITEAEINLIVRFLTRRDSLPGHLRSKFAKDSADRLRSRITDEEIKSLDDEDLLQKISNINPQEPGQ
jgi:uncharacterized RDD family membrane protein YckC